MELFGECCFARSNFNNILVEVVIKVAICDVSRAFAFMSPSAPLYESSYCPWWTTSTTDEILMDGDAMYSKDFEQSF